MNLKLIQYLKRAFLPKRKNKPTILSYLITNRCNSHCISCNVWKVQEEIFIKEKDLEDTLSDEFFSEIKHVGISGGEPSMFSQLYSHIQSILNKLPLLKTLSITSNCINYDFWAENIEKINQLCKDRGIYFQLNVSLDGLEQIHDKIRGTKNNFTYVKKVIELLIVKKISYQIQTTVNKYNVYHVNSILRFAKEKQAEIIFRLASVINRLNNEKLIEQIHLDENQISFFCDFLNSKALLGYTKSPGRRLFYKNMAKQLLGDKKRIAPCYFKKEGVVLDSDGTMSFCSRFDKPFANIYDSSDFYADFCNEELRNFCVSKKCNDCFHDQSGFWSIKTVIFSLVNEKNHFLKKGLTVFKYLFLSFFNCFMRTHSDQIQPANVNSVVIVGMYGGEHVGDAAILGGIVIRLINRYQNLKNIYVYSFRKDRTKTWIDGLKELSDIKFYITDSVKEFIQNIKRSQIIVWGGGPLMELPIVLSRNYFFLKKAKSLGKSIEIEGIGYGPIYSRFGYYITSKILKIADYISVRTEKDYENLSKYSFSTLQKQKKFNDPAFDYLNLLTENLCLKYAEKKEIDQILELVKKRKIIAINLRPLWNRYGNSVCFDYNNFLDKISINLYRLIEKGYYVVFFAMNSDQYGFSDLDIGYDIKIRLKSPYYSMCEFELSINAVVYLLRKVDYALCMRFHAAIFALSQNVKTIGLDYSLSGKGKVAFLFENFDHSNCFNIATLGKNDITSIIL
jgi:MoaA/NifB/PqqE/SkfB family radical SAM enzyme/polysaccharide pyruvyl transferase WcaK-like protein